MLVEVCKGSASDVKRNGLGVDVIVKQRAFGRLSVIAFRR
jgi:hypothetical protein